jgi:hypothetical protein
VVTEDTYIIRLLERPERWVHELLVLRRAGPGQVEYLEYLPDDDSTGTPRWEWVRTEPGVNLPAGKGVVLSLPTDALPALQEALERLLGPPGMLGAMDAAHEAQVARYREVYERELDRWEGILRPIVERLPTVVAVPEGTRLETDR